MESSATCGAGATRGVRRDERALRFAGVGSDGGAFLLDRDRLLPMRARGCLETDTGGFMMWRHRGPHLAGGEQNVTFEDTTTGLRRLAADAPGVATVPVELEMPIDALSWIAGLDEATRTHGTEQGFRDGLVMPNGREFLVLVLIYPEQSVAHRLGMDETVIDGKRIGTFPARERRRWLDTFRDRNVKGILFVDVPAGAVEFRFYPDRIGESAEQAATRAARDAAVLSDGYCGQCGHEIRAGTRFCTRCGAALF